MDHTSRTEPVNPGRRRVLAAFLTAYTASLIPWALAAPVSSQTHGVFLALSAMLVGKPSLDVELAGRLQAALVASTPGFDSDAKSLLALIDSRHIDPAQLQAALDASQSPLAALPRKIVRAWCLGLVGDGGSTQCIAYEEALDNVFVGDVLRPPTYAYGAYGSWARPPISKGDDDHDSSVVS